MRPAAVIVALAGAACSSSSNAPGTPSGLRQPLVGCAAARPAIAHAAGGPAMAMQPANAPVPCSAKTGYTTYDPTLVITASDKLIFGPANAPGLTVSTDEGMTWSKPLALPSPPAGTLLHPWLWQDAASHRVFFNLYDESAPACPDGSGANLWTSDDEGVTWTHGMVGCGSQDWGKVVTGPAKTSASKAALAQSGYPDMVYYCATGPAAIIGPDNVCYRSVDGGETFTETAMHPISGTDGYATSGAVGPDGTFYKSKGSAQGLLVAMSPDEGDTWPTSVVTGSHFVGTSEKNWLSMTVAAGDDGTIYAVWSDDDDLLPYLSYSRDQGGTWSAPAMIGAPGVKTSAFPAVTVKSPGYVAIGYYGSTSERTSGDGYFNTDGLAYSAYLTVTTDLFDAAPVFWSATFNDPASPVFTGLTFQVSEYAGTPVFASDGSVWATYLSGGKGLAGRLLPPPSVAK